MEERKIRLLKNHEENSIEITGDFTKGNGSSLTLIDLNTDQCIQVVDGIFKWLNVKTMQDLQDIKDDLVDTKINLCDSCMGDYGICTTEYAYKVNFGDGYGNDNVIKCSGYEKGDKHNPITDSDTKVSNDGIDESIKKTIDKMSYESMLRLWRFSPSGHPMFQGDTGDYFSKVMKEKSSQLPEGEHTRISKDIGFG